MRSVRPAVGRKPRLRSVVVTWVRALKAGVWLLAMVALGALIGAAQFVPLYEFAAHNFRQGSESYETIVGWAFPPRRAGRHADPQLFWQSHPAHLVRHPERAAFPGNAQPRTAAPPIRPTPSTGASRTRSKAAAMSASCPCSWPLSPSSALSEAGSKKHEAGTRTEHATRNTRPTQNVGHATRSPSGSLRAWPPFLSPLSLASPPTASSLPCPLSTSSTRPFAGSFPTP